ncbi:MAG: DUF805 domain-containing protein [Pseudomonadota bacterium]
MALWDRFSFHVVHLPDRILKLPGGELLEFYLRYAPSFEGRGTRTEFFGTLLATIITNFVFIAIGPAWATLGQPEELREENPLHRIDMLILFFITGLPLLSATVRRLHDTRRRWWAMIVVIAPYVGWIILFIILMLNSDAEENEFGPPPR